MVLTVAGAREVEAFASVSGQLPVENRNSVPLADQFCPFDLSPNGISRPKEVNRRITYVGEPSRLAQPVGRRPKEVKRDESRT
jgi:hypothetical protein